MVPGSYIRIKEGKHAGKTAIVCILPPATAGPEKCVLVEIMEEPLAGEWPFVSVDHCEVIPEMPPYLEGRRAAILKALEK